jgi:serine protease Do
VITEIQKVEPASDATVANSIDVSHIAEMSMPSVVSITNKGVQEIRSWFGTFQQETSGSGSGIIIGENETELLIVTNYHVVSDSKELSVYFSFDEDTALEGEKENVVSAKIKGYDSKKDLAVISVQLSDIPNETKGKISIATLGDSSKLKVGEQVVAIGNALGYGQSVTTGIVSALDREVKLTSNNGEIISNLLIQTDAAINPGNSGGALLNMRGEVIGINSAKLAAQEVEGMGYAIPITAVESIIGDLMNKETRDKVDKEKAGYLGVNIISVTAEAAKMYELPVGVYVKSVVEGSTAEKAGIKVGDVIIKIDGSSVASAEELIEALTYYEAGETVELVIKSRESGYEEQSIEVVLGSRKDAGLE